MPFNNEFTITTEDIDNEIGIEETTKGANRFARNYTKRFNVETFVINKERRVINRYYPDDNVKSSVNYYCTHRILSLDGEDFGVGEFVSIELLKSTEVVLTNEITEEQVGHSGIFTFKMFFDNFRRDYGEEEKQEVRNILDEDIIDKGEEMSAKDRKEKWAKKTKQYDRKLYVKFNPGEKCYLMEDNRIVKRKIDELLIKDGCEHSYTLDNGESYPDHTILFQTRQALIQSLTEEYVARTQDKS